MHRVRLVAAALAGVALFAAACDDPFEPGARLEVRTDTMSVFAMTGTPVTHPSALNLFERAVVRLESGATFDIVFDVNIEGNVVLYPAQLITSAPGQVGLRDTTIAFDQLLRAPGGQYESEEPLELPAGTTAIIEAVNPLCQFQISPFMYAKLIVDSVDVNREIFFRITVDPNCGFRSFEQGLPRN